MLMLGKHLGHTTIRGNDGAYTPLLDSDVTVAKVLQQAGCECPSHASTRVSPPR